MKEVIKDSDRSYYVKKDGVCVGCFSLKFIPEYNVYAIVASGSVSDLNEPIQQTGWQYPVMYVSGLY
jgi:hypothetical protein